MGSWRTSSRATYWDLHHPGILAGVLAPVGDSRYINFQPYRASLARLPWGAEEPIGGRVLPRKRQAFRRMAVHTGQLGLRGRSTSTCFSSTAGVGSAASVDVPGPAGTFPAEHWRRGHECRPDRVSDRRGRAGGNGSCLLREEHQASPPSIRLRYTEARQVRRDPDATRQRQPGGARRAPAPATWKCIVALRSVRKRDKIQQLQDWILSIHQAA